MRMNAKNAKIEFEVNGEWIELGSGNVDIESVDIENTRVVMPNGEISFSVEFEKPKQSEPYKSKLALINDSTNKNSADFFMWFMLLADSDQDFIRNYYNYRLQ